MGDNKEEIKSSNPTEFENLNETILTDTIQETESMEVHHHAHHGHEKKNWRNYFWEFFMLFLAVFCGFLAEIQVEHYVEHQREKKYMIDLVDDVKADTQFIRTEIETITNELRGYDSLTENLNSSNVFSNTQTIYRQYNTYSPLLTPFLTDQTIIQLRNSGNLRLIRNTLIVKQINVYWSWRNGVTKVADRVENRIDKARDFAIKIFDSWATDSLALKSQLDNLELSPFPQNAKAVYLKNLRLLTNDVNLIKQYSNLRINISRSTRIYLWALIEMKKKAVELLQLIDKEYDIK